VKFCKIPVLRVKCAVTHPRGFTSDATLPGSVGDVGGRESVCSNGDNDDEAPTLENDGRDTGLDDGRGPASESVITGDEL